MKPIFPFYGSKWRDARRYPAPRNGKVVEPFAGSAGYSTYYAPADVTLVDADPIIAGLWRYLIAATPREILALPDLEPGQSVDDFDHLPQEAKWLIGFWINRGSAAPKKTQTKWSRGTSRRQLVWSERARERVAHEIAGIRHWRVIEGDFTAAPMIDATYFVDPPYVDKGRHYRRRLAAEDYPRLAAWCRGLDDVIVCEQHGADWLPFRPLAEIKSLHGTSAEVVFTGGAA